MDMMLDILSCEFIKNPIKGEEYARWKNKQMSIVRKVRRAEAQREEEARNEADYLEE